MELLRRYWWMLLLRGIVAILFGLLVLTRPGLSLVALTLAFGAFAFADGVASLIAALAGRTGNWGVMLVAGLVSICVGVITFVAPGATALVLLLYIAFWTIATGLLLLILAIRLRKEIEGELGLGLAGAMSLAFGVLLLVRPGVGALSIMWLIGSYAIALGLTLVVVALRARAFAGRPVAA